MPWPSARLEEIGGGGAAYVQDAVARRELGEARVERALEALEGWCPEVGGRAAAKRMVHVAAGYAPRVYMHQPTHALQYCRFSA